jgi:hypothetical protein
MSEEKESRLLVLWTTGDKVTAEHMVFMYTINAKRNDWLDHVVLLVWGAASVLTAEDLDIQARIYSARQAGVRVIACKKCAENLNVVEALEQAGVEVFYTGEFLTDWLKSGDPILSV